MRAPHFIFFQLECLRTIMIIKRNGLGHIIFESHNKQTVLDTGEEALKRDWPRKTITYFYSVDQGLLSHLIATKQIFLMNKRP